MTAAVRKTDEELIINKKYMISALMTDWGLTLRGNFAGTKTNEAKPCKSAALLHKSSKHQGSSLPCHNVNRHVEYLCHLQDGVDVTACGRGEVVGRAALAPAGDKLARAAGEACAHVRVAERQDFARLVDALGHDKLEVSFAVLRDGKVSNGTEVRVELRQVAAAGLAVEHLDNLHRRLLV